MTMLFFVWCWNKFFLCQFDTKSSYENASSNISKVRALVKVDEILSMWRQNGTLSQIVDFMKDSEAGDAIGDAAQISGLLAI